MMYFDFEAGNKAYKLRLTTRSIMALEAKIGCNPMMVFGSGNRIPTITEMVHILHNSLTHFNHGITFDGAAAIFDEWIADGHQHTDFVQVIIEIYRASGLIAPEAVAENEEDNEDEKN